MLENHYTGHFSLTKSDVDLSLKESDLIKIKIFNSLQFLDPLSSILVYFKVFFIIFHVDDFLLSGLTIVIRAIKFNLSER